MTSRSLGNVGYCLVLAVAVAGCADLERGSVAPTSDASVGDAPVGDDGAAANDGAPLSFASNVRPLLDSCARCHAAGQQAGDTALLFTGMAAADYAAVVALVDTTTPTASRLLAKMRGEGHQGGVIYAADSPEYSTVLHWIQQGDRP